MTHELAGALQQVSWIGQRFAVKEAYVDVRRECIDVAEGRVAQARDWAAVVQKFADFVAAFSHQLKPVMRDGSQFTWMAFHPRIDAGSRSTAPLNRSKSVLIGAPLFLRELRLDRLHEKAAELAWPEE